MLSLIRKIVLALLLMKHRIYAYCTKVDVPNYDKLKYHILYNTIIPEGIPTIMLCHYETKDALLSGIDYIFCRDNSRDLILAFVERHYDEIVTFFDRCDSIYFIDGDGDGDGDRGAFLKLVQIENIVGKHIAIKIVPECMSDYNLLYRRHQTKSARNQ